jgi:ankyrin repeat protein
MSWAHTLSREDLLENIETYRNDSEFIACRNTHLARAVRSKDRELVIALLEAGAGPDIIEPWGDSLQHYLVHEFQVLRSTQGDTIASILESLLAKGANPEHVGANNWRALDMAIDRGLQELVSIFVRHGANPIQREFI